MEERRRIVIFGCGYVGRPLAERLAGEGHEVWVHSRNAETLARVAGVPEDRRIVADLHSTDWHGQLPGDWDAAVNLVSSAGGGLDGYRLSYLEGNRSILTWARSVPVRRLIYTSATSVYPQSDGQWVGEGDVPPAEELSPTGRILREAELEILNGETVPSRIVARLAGIYGPGRHLYLDRLHEGAVSLPGDGSAWLNLVYLPDIVEALLLLLQAESTVGGSVFNVVDDQPARKQEIVDWIAARLNRPSIPFDPFASGQRTGRRGAGGQLPDRRVSNALLKHKHGWKPRFPDYRAGYEDIIARSEQT